LLNANLTDIDELSLKNEHIHTIGGYFGEVLIIFNEMFEKFYSHLPADEAKTAVSTILLKILGTFEKRILDIKYFETIKIDMTTPIDKVSDPQILDNYKAIYYDTKRISSKSIKFMLDHKVISEKIYFMFLDAVINLLLQKPIDPETVIQIDPSITEPEYLEQINKQKEEIKTRNEFTSKIKEKVRFSYAKVEDFKKKKLKMSAVLNITPSDQLEIFKEDEGEGVKTDPNDHHAKKKEEKDESEQIKFPNTALVVQNTVMVYDFYVIHEGATDQIRLKLLNEFKHLVGKDNFNFVENFQQVQNRFKMIKEKIANHITTNEVYYEKDVKGNKKLFEFSVSSIEPKPDPVV